MTTGMLQRATVRVFSGNVMVLYESPVKTVACRGGQGMLQPVIIAMCNRYHAGWFDCVADAKSGFRLTSPAFC